METLTAITSVSDDELMQGVLAGEQAAFNELYSRHHMLLCRIVGQMLPNDGDVEETVQDIFAEVWNRAANFNPSKGQALGWIICMARRRAVDRIRRGRRNTEAKAALQQAAADGATLTASGLSETDQGDPVDKRDLRRALNGVIKDLPVEQQAVIRYVFFQELSQRQIAVHTGIPLGTIKTRLELAISKLSKKSDHLREDLSLYHSRSVAMATSPAFAPSGA